MQQPVVSSVLAVFRQAQFSLRIDTRALLERHDPTLRITQPNLSPKSARNFEALQRTFLQEVGTDLSYGYAWSDIRGWHLSFAVLPDDEEVIGYATAGWAPPGGLISEVVVLPEYRRYHVGQQLLQALETALIGTRSPIPAASPNSARHLHAIVPAPHWGAREFFVHSGYEVTCHGDRYLLSRRFSAPQH